MDFLLVVYYFLHGLGDFWLANSSQGSLELKFRASAVQVLIDLPALFKWGWKMSLFCPLQCESKNLKNCQLLKPSIKFKICYSKHLHDSWFLSHRWQTWYSNNGIHLYLPQYFERNSCHNVKIFLLSSGFSGPDCDSHLMGKSKNLQYVRVWIFSQILGICWVHSIKFFILISKI